MNPRTEIAIQLIKENKVSGSGKRIDSDKYTTHYIFHDKKGEILTIPYQAYQLLEQAKFLTSLADTMIEKNINLQY